MAVYTLFGQPANPATVVTDGIDYTMGMQFSLSVAAALTGIWFWSPTGAASLPDACCIYQITGANTGSQVTGTVNNAPSWSGTAGSGWVKCTYNGSTSLLASTNYRVCIHHPNNGQNFYGSTSLYWSTGPGSGGLTSGIITAPKSSLADGSNQDAYANPSAGLAYPTTSFNSANYWIDVEVTTTASGPVPPLISQYTGYF